MQLMTPGKGFQIFMGLLKLNNDDSGLSRQPPSLIPIAAP
jgi:hypothetical protein